MLDKILKFFFFKYFTIEYHYKEILKKINPVDAVRHMMVEASKDTILDSPNAYKKVVNDLIDEIAGEKKYSKVSTSVHNRLVDKLIGADIKPENIRWIDNNTVVFTCNNVEFRIIKIIMNIFMYINPIGSEEKEEGIEEGIINERFIPITVNPKLLTVLYERLFDIKYNEVLTKELKEFLESD